MKCLLYAYVALLSQATAADTVPDCEAQYFGKLAAEPSIGQCINSSKVPLLTLSTTPSSEQLDQLCETSSCLTALGLVLYADPKDCVVPVGGRIKLISELAEPLRAHCEKNGIPVPKIEVTDAPEPALSRDVTTHTSAPSIKGSGSSSDDTGSGVDHKSAANDHETHVPIPSHASSTLSSTTAFAMLTIAFTIALNVV